MEAKDVFLENIELLVILSSLPSLKSQKKKIRVDLFSIPNGKLISNQKLALELSSEVPELFQKEIDLATGTLSSIQSGSRKLLGKSNLVHTLKVHDGLVYSASSSIEGTVLKILACTMTMLKVASISEDMVKEELKSASSKPGREGLS
ncbi:armadillo-like helical [Artemisia annua]|uniref:Armadillo-like helical n=1 Tax=Artemisia annua TaxID=35608 RepID=A0A2U1QLH2_ARTAN|nr:armadillo-like helical [Artemisia annua]